MTLSSVFKTPFVRQCFGAVVGAVLALGLYYSGTWAFTKAQAMLVSPETKVEIAEQTRDARMDRVAAEVKMNLK